ncbi:hypothetical protein PR002_g27452 [Phytophthora rubi]|uniref:Uncharacterized protein n=1 Tax=Phytophthora rubi TaxID=129364 RepID=A0A6A3HGW9_9STRA|nr:hypothetical protein PR002_g27452 [Phytophthora rubi]
MARTHKTASTKAQMAEQARKEEEARHQVAAARTRSQKSAELACARESRADFKEEEAADEVTEEEEEGWGEGEEEEGEDTKEKEVSTTRTSRRSERGGAEAKGRNRHGKKRSVSDVEEEELLQVPAFQTHVHPIEVSLQEYMEVTRQKSVIKEVINVARRNADLRKQIRFQGCPDSEIPLVPETWEPYQRKHICTQDWSARERSTGK